MMRYRAFILIYFVAVAVVNHVQGLQSSVLHQRIRIQSQPIGNSAYALITNNQNEPSFLFSNDGNNEKIRPRKRDALINFIQQIRNVPRDFNNSLSQSKAMRMALMISSISAVFGGGLLLRPSVADASAPVMALPKSEGRDPASEAIMEYERRQVAKTQQQLNEMTVQARKIEAEQGEAARIKFENEYKERQQQIADQRVAGLVQLKLSLLEQGICPFTDVEGQRQVMLYTRGVDLGKVPGTQFYLEKEFERSAPKKSLAYKKALNRKIIECMVRDMKNRGIDPVNYFEKHQDQTEAILDMPIQRAAALVQQYEANLEAYGQIVPPKEGELSVKEQLAIKDPEAEKAAALAAKEEEKAAALAAKEQEKSAAAEAKAQEKAAVAAAKAAKAKEKAEQKEREKAEKELKKAEALAAKEAAKFATKKAEEELKTSIAAGAAAAATAAAATALGSAVAPASTIPLDGLQDSVSSIVDQIEAPISAIEETESLEQTEIENADIPQTTAVAATTASKKDISSTVKGGAAFLVVGGSGVAFKIYRDKVEKDEEERKRQLRLLMEGGSTKKSTPAPAPALEEIDFDITDGGTNNKKSETIAAPPKPTETVAPAPKKRKLGLKSVFGKKKNARETDLMVLVSEDAEAPEFTKTLAKLLAFGAVGRFPSVVSLPGGTTMENFELEQAKQILIDAQTEAGLSLEASAEIFANVVNCMLIDIVDLASASLKEKDEKVTVDAINVVVDFMNHAASLYDSIAEGVAITPVTYGGDLGKSKLEQMYSAYAVSGMMNMDKMSEDFDNRVAMLQDVFQINEKKAEGLMMKAMQKNMMNILKNGEGMEGMEEMLKSMGGLDGMMPPGMGGVDGDGPSPEQLKEMLTALKQMKDSGSIPPDEFDKVKKQLNEAFGSSIDDVVKEASANNEELSSTDKELLELMKSIMKD